LAQFQIETFLEAQLFFVLYICFVMRQGSNQDALAWRANKSQSATIFDIDTPVGPLTVVLCTKDEAETLALYRRIERETGKDVLHIAVAAGQGRANYPVGLQVHELPMYHKGRLRDEALENFWSACKETALAGQAVVIHCNQSFHRGPLCLVAIMVRAGYSKDRALDIIAESRCIYAGHHVPYEHWPPDEREGRHAEDVLECHLWLERLLPDAADALEPDAAHALELDDAGHSLDDADALEPDDADALALADAADPSSRNVCWWRCSSCNVVGQRLLQCWVCSRWDCKSCSFWCTHCPKGRRKYTICGHCNAEGNHLFRQGKIWSCPNCS